MFSMDFFRGKNEILEKTNPQQGMGGGGGGARGADVKCNSPFLR